MVHREVKSIEDLIGSLACPVIKVEYASSSRRRSADTNSSCFFLVALIAVVLKRQGVVKDEDSVVFCYRFE